MEINTTKNFKFIYDNYKTTRGFLLEGGSRSGKTYSIIQFIVVYCQLNSGKTITIARDTLANLKATVLPDFQKILIELKQYKSENHNKSEHIYTLNGNTIRFIGLNDDIMRAHGIRQDVFWINEAISTKRETFDQLEQRTEDFWICDYNPNKAKHWLYNLEKRDDVKMKMTTVLDNPFAPPEVRKKILSYEPTPTNKESGTADSYMWEVYGKGRRAAGEQVIFPDYTIIDELPKEYDKRIFGLDFGYSHDPAAIVEILFSGNNIYVQEHLYEIGKSNEDLAKILKPLVEGCIVICDSAEPKSIAEIRKHGINARPCVKGQDSVKFGLKSLKTKRINITKNSLNLDDELTGYMWKKEKDGTISDIPEGADHLIDALRYGFTYVISIKKIIV